MGLWGEEKLREYREKIERGNVGSTEEEGVDERQKRLYLFHHQAPCTLPQRTDLLFLKCTTENFGNKLEINVHVQEASSEA